MAEYDDSLPAQLAAAREMVIADQLEEAWILLNRLDAMYPEWPEIIALMGDTSLRAGDAEHAWELYDRAIEIDPTWSGVWSARARCSIDLCDLDAARGDTVESLSLDGQNAEAWYANAILAEFDGDMVLAEACYKKASTLEPENFHRPFRVRGEDEFEKTMWGLFEELTAESPVPVQVTLEAMDIPGIDDIAETGLSPLTPSFIEFPPEEEGVFTEITPAPIIFLYKRNIERLAKSMDDIKREIELSLANELINLFEEYGEPVPKALLARSGESD